MKAFAAAQLGRGLLAAVSLAVIAGVAALTGCSRESAPTAAAIPAPEVRGEPIRGEPIVPPAAPAPTVATAPTTPPAEISTPAPPAAPAGQASVATTTAGTETAPVSATTPAPAPTELVAAAPKPSAEPAALARGTPQQPLSIGFEKLAAFTYDLPEGPVDTNTVATTQAAQQIPAEVKALNNQFVSLKGFMLPLKVEKGLVTELLMMRDQSMCCYGTVPRINEWVSVKMVGPGVKPSMDQAVTLYGTLKVGEIYENGYLVGIYAMDAERMAGPLDL